MQDILSRRKLLISGLAFVASSAVAFARDGEGNRLFWERKKAKGQGKKRYPDFWESWDGDYDDDWSDSDDRYYGEDEYDPALLPPPEAGIDYPIEPVDPSRIAPRYRRQVVDFSGPAKTGSIVVDPAAHFLYHVREHREAVRYGVGVGRAGFAWSGEAEIRMKRRWPRWVPPKEMVARDERAAKWANGQPGGPGNPLGARALYLFSGGKDTLYRIHGTTEPESIGKSVSSGCVRMLNEDVADLFEQVAIGTQVIVRGA
ncbi:MAG: L,D-transpeptidase [Aestuariivirga sp.]|nr:L,D-transpeptidase [Aestuariivirga sp.]